MLLLVPSRHTILISYLISLAEFSIKNSIRFINGVINVGTGQDRSWDDLVKAVFSAMKLPLKIEYIDMPKQLRDRYQYFTRANVEKQSSTGWPVRFTTLEEAVNDSNLNIV